MLQCAHGHTLCEMCHSRLLPHGAGNLTKCPSCRVFLDREIRSLATERIAASERLNCSFTADGCNFSSVCSELRLHHLECAFRTVTCPQLLTFQGDMKACSWVGPENKLMQHMRAAHDAMVVRTPMSRRGTASFHANFVLANASRVVWTPVLLVSSGADIASTKNDGGGAGDASGPRLRRKRGKRSAEEDQVENQEEDHGTREEGDTRCFLVSFERGSSSRNSGFFTFLTQLVRVCGHLNHCDRVCAHEHVHGTRECHLCRLVSPHMRLYFASCSLSSIDFQHEDAVELLSCARRRPASFMLTAWLL